MFRNIGLGCGGLLLLLIILAAIGSAMSGGKGTTSSSPAANDQGSASASALAAPSKAATVLLDVTGTGIKSTQKFTAGGDWDLNWSYDCSNFGSSGNFSVTIYGKDSSDYRGLGANELGAKGADVSHQHDSGTFYLDISSECAWHVTVKG